MQRLRAALASAAVLLGLLVFPGVAPAHAAEALLPGSLTLGVTSPAPDAVVGGTVTVTGSAAFVPDPVPTARRVVLFDLTPDANGFSCGVESAVTCGLQVLGQLAGHMVERGNTQVAVLGVSTIQESFVDLDPAPGLQLWSTAERLQALLAANALLDQPRGSLTAPSSFQEAARIAGAGDARIWAITPGGPAFRPSADDFDALVASGVPVDVYTTETGAGTPCGSYSNSTVDTLASFTGGTCTRQADLTLPTRDARLLVAASWASGGASPAFQGLAGDGPFSFTIGTPPASIDGRATLEIVLTDRHGHRTATTRTVRLGPAPVVDAGPEVVVDEGQEAVLSGATISSPAGVRSISWSPASAFANAATKNPTFVDSADDHRQAVSVTVTSARGLTASDATDVVVANVEPTIDVVRDSSEQVAVGEPTVLRATVSDPGVRDTHTVDVDWADGTVDHLPVPATGVDFQLPHHRYSTPGDRLVQISVVDDDGGRSDTRQVRVVVEDVVGPSFPIRPSDVEVEAADAGGAVATFVTPAATDDVDASPTVECDPGSGSTFPVGETVVTCSATDDAGNRTETTFTVRVVDTVAPVLEGLPSGGTWRAGPDGAATIAYVPPTARDAVDGVVPVVCDPAPGANLPVGSHTVTCSARDAAGNHTAGTFEVIVVPGYSFLGFDRPVDAGVWNVVRGGQVVPLKWRVLDAAGVPVRDVAVIRSIRSFGLTCSTGAAEDPIDVVAAGASALRFDEASGRFQLNWQTPSTTGCLRLVVKLVDGTTGAADFRIR